MPQIYEGMFVLDNNVVREGWDSAKAVVTETLTKHGGSIHCARRWDERRLAYPIKGRRRGTYLLAYYEMPIDAISAMRRDFDLSERVLRYLETAVDGVPEGEAELAAAEGSTDFIVPEPPADDAPDPEDEAPAEEAAADKPAEGGGDKPAEEAKAEATKAEEAPAEEAKAAEAPAAEAPAAEAPAETPAEEGKE